MVAPLSNSYSVGSGVTMYTGRSRVPKFDSVSIFSEDSGVPYSTPNQTFIFELHGSSGQNYTSGRQYRAQCSGYMAYDVYTEFAFSTIRTYVATETKVRPNDLYGTAKSLWMGFGDIPSPSVHMITKRRLEALLLWVETNLTTLSPTRRCMTGWSMGAWGTMTFGLRRPDKFASIYPDRPRWRYDATIGNVAVPYLVGNSGSVLAASAPHLAVEDGGASIADVWDSTSYVANTANKIPWICFFAFYCIN